MEPPWRGYCLDVNLNRNVLTCTPDERTSMHTYTHTHIQHSPAIIRT